MIERDGVRCLEEDEKRALLREAVQFHGLRTFVETGTYRGDTVAAMLAEPRVVDEVYSFELSEELYAAAHARFEGEGRLYLFCGDSGKWVRHILSDSAIAVRAPALFWLDAHAGEVGTAGAYGECPLREELRVIFAHSVREHVVYIDDVRLFGHGQWPTVDEVREMARAAGYTFEVIDDIARITRP